MAAVVVVFDGSSSVQRRLMASVMDYDKLGCTFLFSFLFWGDRNLEQDFCSY
jgi:hypothetical protein